ncbi:hypothetical protein [Maribacter sp. 2-571]|uniref:hypothetical protein n=1 Tax=Maribacter sp. 2-571 TaxID=3417569 RepID=UPI003D351B08
MRRAILCLLGLLVFVPLYGQLPIRVLGSLSDGVSETSGLLFYKDKLLTHNDSGNAPQLFVIDTLSRRVERVVQIENAVNIDWEAMAQDNDYMYIGDLGNVSGLRTDLTVYRIAKNDFDNADTVNAETIVFSYPDQTAPEPDENSDFDAEAMFVLHDKLVVLTKQWRQNGTTAYTIPKIPGRYTAERWDSLSSIGLVTGATYNEATQLLYFTGYSRQLSPFVYRVEGVLENSVFGGAVTRLPINIGFAQVEGITDVDANTYMLSSEFFERQSPSITFSPTLYSLTTEDMEVSQELPEPITEPEPDVMELVVYQPVGRTQLSYVLPNEHPRPVARAIFSLEGQLLRYQTGDLLLSDTIFTADLPNGTYVLTLYFGEFKLTRAFVLY